MFKTNPVGEEGVEPSWTEAQQILSLSCMPFHHSPGMVAGQLALFFSQFPACRQAGATPANLPLPKPSQLA